MIHLLRQASFAFAVILAGCTITVHSGKIGDDVAGPDVAKTIALQLVPLLKSANPSYVIGKPICPAHMDVSGNRRATCTLPVDGVNLPITVSAGPDVPHPFVVRQAATLVRGSDLNVRVAQGSRRDSGLPVNADRGFTGLRVLSPGTPLRCRVVGPAIRTWLTVRLQRDGRLFVPHLPGHRSPLERAIEAFETLHRDGKVTHVPGTLLSAFVREQIDGEFGLTPGFNHVRAGVRCPLNSDLTADRRVVCTARIATVHIPYDVWMTGDTIHARSEQMFAPTRRIESVAAEYYRTKLVAAGFDELVAVDCGPPRWEGLGKNDTLACSLLLGNDEKRSLKIHVDPATGRVEYYVPPR